MESFHDPDEVPTKQQEHVPTKLLAFASRIDRLAELALERLAVAPDADAVAGAIADLVQVRTLAGDVLR
jgi:ApbE superfamily uncharacterized protein (UPF0280 family)